MTTGSLDAAVERIMQRQAEAAAKLVVGARVMVRLNPECPAYPHHGQVGGAWHDPFDEGRTGTIYKLKAASHPQAQAIHTPHLLAAHCYHLRFDDPYIANGSFSPSELVLL